MNQSEVQAALEKHGALLHGHFKLSSGRHSDTYIQKQHVLSYPRLTARLGEAIAARHADSKFDTVLSPALGAILLGSAVAYAADCRFIFAERFEDKMALRRGQGIGPENRVLIVEDIVTTGGSVGEVIGLVEDALATCVGVACLADRTNVALPFVLDALVKIDARDFAPEECQQCEAGEPLDSPGSRFLG